MDICCLEEAHLETILLPEIFIDTGKGFEVYNTNIYIPSESDLAS